MTNLIVNAVITAVLEFLLNWIEGKRGKYVVSKENIAKLNTVYKTIEQKSKEALEAIEKPIDPTLPKEEREKQREQAADDFFDKLR